MFIDDLKTYLLSNGLIGTGNTIMLEFYDDTSTTELICLACYDSDPSIGRYSFQFLCRNKSVATSRDRLFTIYNHFFDVYQPLPVYKVIGTTKCQFKPLNKPTFLKKENGLVHYIMNVEVWTQKN